MVFFVVLHDSQWHDRRHVRGTWPWQKIWGDFKFLRYFQAMTAWVYPLSSYLIDFLPHLAHCKGHISNI